MQKAQRASYEKSVFFRKEIRITCTLLLLIGCVLSILGYCPYRAFAANAAFDANSGETFSYIDEHTGNAFLFARDAMGMQVGGDLYWVGDALQAHVVQVGTDDTGGSFLAAGRDLNFSDIQVQSSVRAAAETMTFAQASIGNNITVAGKTITLASNVSANGLYAAAELLDVAGTYTAGALVGKTVTLTAHVSGDMGIYAETVVITKDAKIDGTLTVPNNANLIIEEGAQVGNIVEVEPLFTQTTGLDPIATVVGPLLFSCIAHILLMLLYGWLMRDGISYSADAMSNHAGPIVLYGLIACIAAPFAALFCIALLVTAPIGVLIVAAMALLWLFSIPFVGLILGKVVFRNMPEKRAGVIGVVTLTVLCYVPGLFVVVPSLCAMVTAGLAVNRFIEKRRQCKAGKIGNKSSEYEGLPKA